MAFADRFYLDADGLHWPDYPTILADLNDEYRAIFGADVYLEADSQEGQWLAILARSLYDCCLVSAQVYNSFSPLTALGDALSRQVKINGIRRLVPTNSTVDLLIEGTVGTQIPAGIAQDDAGNKWALPADVLVPVEGSITVTATAVEQGAIAAAPDTITKIVNPTRGWFTVTNTSAAVEGDPSETDAELRFRQTESTMIPSLSVMEGIVGAVASVDGVLRHRGYENDTDSTDSDGIPGHTIALVVEGGDNALIAQAIHRKKTAGTGTWGPSGDVTGGQTVNVADEYGVVTPINFIRPTDVAVDVVVSVTPLEGYSTSVAAEIKAAVAAYINALSIGDDVFIGRLYTPANLGNVGDGATFYVDSIEISRDGDPVSSSNVEIDFNEMATCDPAVNILVVPPDTV
jgi:uncharacterized phage protein gp47/JayE